MNLWDQKARQIISAPKLFKFKFLNTDTQQGMLLLVLLNKKCRIIWQEKKNDPVKLFCLTLANASWDPAVSMQEPLSEN